MKSFFAARMSATTFVPAVLVVLSFFIFPNQVTQNDQRAFAQTAQVEQTDESLQSKPQPFDSTMGIELPSVAINELLMNEYKYTPGETLTISMYIENVMSSPTEFKYKTRILPIEGKYISSNSAPQVVLSASPFSERIVLRPNETRQIEIKYTMPTYIKGNVLLVVGAVNSAGVPIGSKSLHLADRTIPRILPNKNIKPTSASTSVLTVQKTNPIDITKITFTQGDISFEPLGGSSGYLLKEAQDLKIRVKTEGKSTEDAFISIKVSNVHSSSTFDSVYQYIDTKLNAPEVELTIKHESLQTGQYQIEITPVSKAKVPLGPSRMITIGVEGLTGIIQALEVRGGLPVKKGAQLRVLAIWVPIVQLSKEMRDQMDTDPELNTAFSANISLTNENGAVVASTTLVGVTPDINTVLSAQTRAQSLNAYIEILVGKKVLATYSKEVLLPPLEKSKNTRSVWDYILYTLIVLGVAGALYLLVKALLRFFKNRKNIATGALIFALSLSSIPSIVSAAWVQVATTSFDHLYPKSIEATATTWATSAQALNSTYWTGVTPYSKSCTKRIGDTVANSNDIVQILPNISGDNKMYRWENIWYRPLLTRTDWYSASTTYWGAVPTAQPTGWATTSKTVVVPGIYASTGFIHTQDLNKAAAHSDDIQTYNTASPWYGYRPIRASSTNGMGTNPLTALIPDTFTNLMSWLNARYNALEFRNDSNLSTSVTLHTPYARQGYGGYSTIYDKIETLVGDGIRAAVPATPGDVEGLSAGISSIFNPTPPTFDQRMLAVQAMSNYENGANMNDDSMLVLDARGWIYNFLNAQQSGLNSGDYSLSDVPNLNSRAGNSTLLNFLYTYRDETNGSTTASNYYDCYSGNIKVSQNTYTVIDNSYIEIIMFYDEDEDGIKDEGEKTLSTWGDNGASNVQGLNQGEAGGTSCVVPSGSFYSTFHSSSSDLHIEEGNPIATLYSDNEYTNEYGPEHKGPAAYVKTVNQVANPVFFDDFNNYNSTPRYTYLDDVYTIHYDFSHEINRNLPNAWALGSRAENYGKSFYDSSGRLVMLTGASACGQTIVTATGGAMNDGTGYTADIGDDREENYNKEVTQFPVPASAANASTVYWKIPVNSQLSSQYIVGVDEYRLPTGWVSTVTAVNAVYEQKIAGSDNEKKISISGQNRHYPVYLGVKYEANGVCGAATSAGLTAPTTNLCNAGTASAVVENEDNQTYDWSCSGIGSGGVDAVCEKPKCSGTQYFCDETNSCVESEDDCIVDAVCGSATTVLSTLDENDDATPLVPTANLCAAGDGLSGSVAGEGITVSYFSWLCAGSNNGADASCEQTKCGNGKVFCQYDSEGNEVNNCQPNCDIEETTIFNTSLVPKIVRDPALQCNFSWSVNASSTNPVSCTLDGTALSDDPEIVNRSRLINVGRHALECSNSNGTSVQSTTTRCQLTPNYKEI